MRNVTSQIGPILEAIRRHQKGSRCGELLKRGIRISFLGPPNAGKSSLLHVIVDREASIVSEEAGTTRDIVEVSVDIGGYLCVFADLQTIRVLIDQFAADWPPLPRNLCGRASLHSSQEKCTPRCLELRL